LLHLLPDARFATPARRNVVNPVVERANHTHMLAAGHDIPYVQFGRCAA
jgi:hypothetical protein